MSSRYEIVRERTDSHDNFYCADYEWRVLDRRTNRIVATFEESQEGGEGKGVSSVTLSADGVTLYVRYHDGREEKRKIP